MDRVPYSKKRVVLVIDSDQIRGAKLKKILNDYGYRVYTAVNFKEARRILSEKKKIDVAILSSKRFDIAPGQILEDFNLGKPVIVILEKFSEEIAASALKAGAVDFLTYPVDSEELVKRLGVCVRMADDGGYERLRIDVCAPMEKGGGASRFRKRIFQGLYPGSTEKELLDHGYEKLNRLGIGSFGEVWKIKDVTKDPPEIFIAKIPLDKKFNAEFEEEAHILRKLAGHKGIPKVIEMIEIKNKRVMIQEFILGKTLYEVIERELEEAEIASVVIQLADVVAHSHGIGIIHRDIKPGNVMVQPDGSIKLLDFGTAKELREKETSETATGTRPYMAPEQIMGKSQRRSDVWALGVVMYVLYTGMFPFYHEVEKVLMDIIIRVPPSPPSKFNEELDPGIERIILKCLEKSPEDRYPDARALKENIIDSFPGYGENILPLY
jgi:CheY-like chemotaxis protein/predicted Ser/Thr protein kinase